MKKEVIRREFLGASATTGVILAGTAGLLAEVRSDDHPGPVGGISKKISGRELTTSSSRSYRINLTLSPVRFRVCRDRLTA
jgi:hypothetical protein